MKPLGRLALASRLARGRTAWRIPSRRCSNCDVDGRGQSGVDLYAPIPIYPEPVNSLRTRGQFITFLTIAGVVATASVIRSVHIKALLGCRPPLKLALESM